MSQTQSQLGNEGFVFSLPLSCSEVEQDTRSEGQTNRERSALLDPKGCCERRDVPTTQEMEKETTAAEAESQADYEAWRAHGIWESPKAQSCRWFLKVTVFTQD